MSNDQRGIKIRESSDEFLPIGVLMERIIAAGDISALAPDERAHYLIRVAESIGLNPLTRPFDLIPGQGGKLVLYANKGAADQLRRMYGLTSRVVSRETVEGVYVVEVEVGDGRRSETNIGAVPIKGLQGEALANALMKTITKGKRRATLDFCGLGVLDESELDGLRGAREFDAPTHDDLRERQVDEMPARPAVSGAVVTPEESSQEPWGEVIDAETGEMRSAETLESVTQEIADLSGMLGFDGEKVMGLAKSIKANYRNLTGARQLRSALLGMLPDPEPAGEAGDDVHTH